MEYPDRRKETVDDGKHDDLVMAVALAGWNEGPSLDLDEDRRS